MTYEQEEVCHLLNELKMSFEKYGYAIQTLERRLSQLEPNVDECVKVLKNHPPEKLEEKLLFMEQIHPFLDKKSN